MKHPWNEGIGKGKISEQLGWVCVGGFEDQPELNIAIFSDREHGACEMYQPRIPNPTTPERDETHEYPLKPARKGVEMKYRLTYRQLEAIWEAKKAAIQQAGVTAEQMPEIAKRLSKALEKPLT